LLYVPNEVFEQGEYSMDVVYNLKKFRTDNKLSQEDVAEVLDITQQQYSRYEVGINEIPVRHIVTLCKHYRISADWLLGLKEE